MYSHSNNELKYIELINAQSGYSYAVSASQVQYLKELTRGQASNKQWFKYRDGQIIALSSDLSGNKGYVMDIIVYCNCFKRLCKQSNINLLSH